MRLNIAAMLLVLSLAGCATMDTSVSTRTGSPQDRLAIHQLLMEWERAFNAHDMEALMATYALEADSIDPSGMKLVKGRDAIQRLMQAKFADNPNIQTKESELEVRFLSPTLAVQSGYWVEDIPGTELDGKGIHGMWTSVVRKVDGQWLYIIERFWPEQAPE